MNKVILMGRLARDPELRYGGANNTAVAHFSLAVERKYRRDNDPEADFFNCTSFNKQAEFVEKYLRKGSKILLEGEIRNNNYTNREGQMVYAVQILTSNIEFAEGKRAAENNAGVQPPTPNADGFMNIPEELDDELPFN